jgi:sugar (pentulose or hexulose) kinase
MTWIQYVGFCLSGVAVSEISSMSCQTHLMDVNTGRLSSFVRAMGWEKFFPPFAKAWEPIGSLREKFRGKAFRGAGQVLAGVHDSNGNYLRYLAAGRKKFTLLSTGTWIIAFDTEARLQSLDESRGMVSNTDVLGNHVVCCRFFGGKEFEILGEGVPGDKATLDAVQDLIAQSTFALPYFSDSIDGPVPHRSGSRGRVVGPAPASPEQKASLASLYCALMVSESLTSIGSRCDIIVDGPFSENLVFLSVLAQLRPGQNLFASDLRDGTTAGAACLGLMRHGNLPHVPLSLARIHASELAGLRDYAVAWLDLARR